jgi:pentatricopeptide repeat protein
MHDEIIRLGKKPDRLTYNTLISACVKAGKLDAAMQYFEEMKVPSYMKGQFRACL